MEGSSEARAERLGRARLRPSSAGRPVSSGGPSRMPTAVKRRASTSGMPGKDKLNHSSPGGPGGAGSRISRVAKNLSMLRSRRLSEDDSYPCEIRFLCTFHKSFARSSKRQVKIDLFSEELHHSDKDGREKTALLKDLKDLNSPNPGVVEFTVDHGTKERNKKLEFEYEEESARFLKAVRVLREHGPKLREIFDQITIPGSKGIANETTIAEKIMDELKPAVESMGGEEAVHEMALAIVRLVGRSAEEERITFSDFFVFVLALENPPSLSLAGFLQHWINRIEDVGKASFDERTRASSGFRKTGSEYGSFANPHGFEELPGEIVNIVEDDVRASFIGQDKAEEGSLFITNYRMVFSTKAYFQQTTSSVHFILGQLQIPLGTISSIEHQHTGVDNAIIVMCKDLRRVAFSFIASNDMKVNGITSLTRSLAFPKCGIEGLFAFDYLPMFNAQTGTSMHAAASTNGWGLYDPMAEYGRQGCLMSIETAQIQNPMSRLTRARSFTGAWRVFNNAETGYKFSPTYPGLIIVPKVINDKELQEAAQYRSKKRVPAVTYHYQPSGAVIARSSQPMVGVSNKRSESDERLLMLLRTKGGMDLKEFDDGQSKPFYIFDCRGQMAAMGNQTQGKGVENVSNYTNTELRYCNIGNIHTMRASLEKVADVTVPSGDEESLNWLEAIDSSNWLHHIRLILVASTDAALLVMKGSSVLVHCSDGWDRTAQISATTQVLLDPYYRTIRGFAVLVEKDWCAFGHKFTDRCGHASSETSQERSPIFMQWLDAIHQLQVQFPTAFEFNESLLVFLADHIFSGLFGTFLGNCEKERVTLEMRDKTESIWTYILQFEERYINPHYVASSLADNSPTVNESDGAIKVTAATDGTSKDNAEEEQEEEVVVIEEVADGGFDFVGTVATGITPPRSTSRSGHPLATAMAEAGSCGREADVAARGVKPESGAFALRPNTALKKMKLWERYLCRWDASMHPTSEQLDCSGHAPWADDWGSVSSSFESEPVPAISTTPAGSPLPHASPLSSPSPGAKGDAAASMDHIPPAPAPVLALALPAGGSDEEEERATGHSIFTTTAQKEFAEVMHEETEPQSMLAGAVVGSEGRKSPVPSPGASHDPPFAV